MIMTHDHDHPMLTATDHAHEHPGHRMTTRTITTARRPEPLEVGAGYPTLLKRPRMKVPRAIETSMSDPISTYTGTFWPMVVEQTNRGERGYDFPLGCSKSASFS
jgi:hypothetical protein